MYSLNTELARAASSLPKFSRFIDASGKYFGQIQYARQIVSSLKKTEGIEIMFVSDSGEKARHTIWTRKADGTSLQGEGLIMALMTVLRVRNMKPAKGTIVTYDYDAKQEVEKTVDLFPELANKKLHVGIRMAEYVKQNGGIGQSAELTFFADEHGFTAEEILDKAKAPVAFEQQVAHLTTKKLKGHAAETQVAEASVTFAPTVGTSDVDLSDIPF